MSSRTDSGVLTTRQAADALGMSLTSVQKMVVSGELEAWVTPGGHRRIHQGSVNRLLNARAAPRPASANQEAMRILLVEDDPIQVRFFQSIVERCSFSVDMTVANDASQALILLERMRPDLVITDLLMAPLDGFHLIKALTREPAYYPIDTIVVSSMGKTEALERGPIPDWVAYYQKPTSPERLLGYLDAMQTRVVKRRPSVI
jgi:excisionase family DNA binding protein